MNTQTISLTSTSSAANYTLTTQYFDDITEVTVDILNYYETILPAAISIDWGDGSSVETHNNEFYIRYRETSIFNELLRGKFTSLLVTPYTHTYYPSQTALYLDTQAQIAVRYTDGNTSTYTIPIQLRKSDYYETIYDMELINTAIMPLTGNNKNFVFGTSEGGHIIEATN